MRNETATQTLAQRVATKYDRCRDVNGSWREFTNELGTLNLFGILEEGNYEFVAELMMDDEEFENEDFDAMLEAIGEYLAPLMTVPEWINQNDLEELQRETGITAEEVAELALAVGVREEEVAAYLAEAA